MFSQELIGEIIALGAIVLPVTQAIKKWLKVEGTAALIISGIVTVLLALWRTLSVEPYDWAKFVIISLGVFLEANGIYHFGAYAIGKAVTKKEDPSSDKRRENAAKE